MRQSERDQAFAEFVAAYSGELLRVAYLLTGDQAAAEDLLQTAMLKTYLAWPRLDQTVPLGAYVRRVLYTTHVSGWRRRRFREVLTGTLPERPHQADQYAEHDERDRLWRLVSRLPAMQRATIVLRFYEDRSEQETARLLGIAPGTVKAHTSRGLARLRELEQRSAPDPPAVPAPAPLTRPVPTQL
jgi:RNA polymerase sigma-70 factor (sigma-E family)